MGRMLNKASTNFLKALVIASSGFVLSCGGQPTDDEDFIPKPDDFAISGVTGGSDTIANNYLSAGVNPTIHWNASNNTTSFTVKITNVAGTTDICALESTTATNFNFSSCSLSEGLSYQAQVSAVGLDSTVQANNSPFQFIIDTTLPTVSIDSQPSDPSNDNTPTFTFSGSDAASGIASFECEIDSGGFTACTSPHTLSPLSDGSHSFNVRSIDNAGHISTTANSTWTVDTIAPNEPLINASTPLSPSDISNPSFSGTAELNSTVTLFTDSICSVSVATGTADGAGNFNINYTVPFDATQTYYITATDAANNESVCSTSSVTYENYTISSGVAWLQGNQTTAAASPTNFNQTAAESIQWGNLSRFDSTYYSHSTITNSHQVTIKTAGNYFAAVTVPLSGTLSRGNVMVEIFINGVAVDGSIGASAYIRNSSNQTESSDHVNLLLSNLAVNDLVEVKVSRAAGTGTMTVSQASLYLEYISGTRTIFSGTATATTNSTNLNQSTAYEMQWTEDIKTIGFNHNDVINPEDIQIGASGDYIIHVNIPLYATATRPNVKLKVLVDGIQIPGGVGQQGYIRSASGHNESSIHFSGMAYNLSNNSIISISVEQEAAAGTVTVLTGKKASIFIEKLDTTTGIFFARGTDLWAGTNFNPTTKDSLLWSTNEIKDTNYYSHNTSTNSHQITIQQDGDYLLLYNDSLTSTVQRANPKISVEVNGLPISGAETKSHYIRSSSGHNESSGNMVFYLYHLKAGDIVTLNSIAEAATGNVAANNDAILSLIHKP